MNYRIAKVFGATYTDGYRDEPPYAFFRSSAAAEMCAKAKDGGYGRVVERDALIIDDSYFYIIDGGKRLFQEDVECQKEIKRQAQEKVLKKLTKEERKILGF